MKNFVIAIDGQSASGKGTLALRVADRFSCKFLPTGNLYRLVGFHLIENNMDLPKAQDKISEMSKKLDFELLYSSKLNDSNIAAKASSIAKVPLLRNQLNQLQFDWIEKNKVAILEGRDIGTVICPEAQVKLYLVASAEARARRRLEQYHSEGKVGYKYQDILKNLQERDQSDSTRKTAPMKKAENAVLIDTSLLTADEVYRKSMNAINKAYEIYLKG